MLEQKEMCTSRECYKEKRGNGLYVNVRKGEWRVERDTEGDCSLTQRWGSGE